jgi:ABC-type glycerol-3-phosphate transport system substrate-binding protein
MSASSSYNKDLLQAVGLDPETPPTDWDTASSMAQKVQGLLDAAYAHCAAQ